MQQIKISPKLGFSDGILSPAEIGDALVTASVAKSGSRAGATFALSILGGAFIALGAMSFTAVMVGAEPTGVTRLVGGLMFSVGLVLVLIAGAELFTGNALMLLAYWRGRVRMRALLRNWTLVFVGNAVGAIAVAGLIWSSGLFDGAQGALARGYAEAKLALSPETAFVRGVLCNIFVCLAVWMSYSSRTPVGKIACALLPVAAFITIGLEHSIANLYILPAGAMAGAVGADPLAIMANIGPVALGNFVGAAIVAALYAYALEPVADEAVPPAASAPVQRGAVAVAASDDAAVAAARSGRARVRADA